MEKNLGPLSAVRGPVTDAQQRLLDVLATFDTPATLAQVVAATALHENTVRGHLEALHERGHVTRLRVAPQGRGRPAWSWVARRPAYAGLVEALAEGIESGTGLDAREAGRRGGRVWGEHLADQIAAGSDSPRTRMIRVFEHIGFAPEAGPDGTLRLTRCPFLDAARDHQDSVCSVHRGLIEGALGDTTAASTLRPFAEPGACLARLP